ncbi:uracil-DNA glycosylase family protein [Oricola sp.]|uniref:uracil-DNA glycosylase family protein n=1 Tax=Oricola sp. TaxID=1979950 RepID=UPI003BA897DA
MTGGQGSLPDAIRGCRVCRDEPRFGAPLAHEPNPVCVMSQTARIGICGQAPGIRVHRSGRPFTDPSGDRLRQWMGIDEAAFYDASRLAIVPMGFCFPGHDAKGGDLPPRRECRATWHDAVFAAMPQLELVVAIGRYAQAYHLGAAARPTLTETVRAWRESFEAPSEAVRAGPRILPLPHPSWRNNAWIRRNPWFEAELLPVLRAEVRRLIV